jgi:hypothetical protein
MINYAPWHMAIQFHTFLTSALDGSEYTYRLKIQVSCGMTATTDVALLYGVK